jgi:hypothetical protein
LQGSLVRTLSRDLKIRVGGKIILATALSVSYNMLFYLNYNRLSAGADCNIVAVALHIASFEASRNLLLAAALRRELI